ncbi:hypothetical protein [Kitasatospora sp. NPDC097691]|uniref:protein kinase domain-containing protein n=1 Tax=Kitasatospora sp. NPDC097691 TaxID=3157231 RepID=UPI00332AA183
MGTTEDTDPAEDDRRGPRPWSAAGAEPRNPLRSRVGRWSRGHWRGSDAAPDRSSRLGVVPLTQIDPQAATGRASATPPRFDPGAATRRIPGAEPRYAPHARTSVRPDRPGRQDSGGPHDDTGDPSEGAFPDVLRDRFIPLGRAGTGSEGTVWYVRRTDDGGDAAVKVAAAGQPMDHALLDHLRNDGFRRHVPHLIDFGRVRQHGAQVDWVAMEYLPVTLAAHVAGLWREAGHTDRRTTGQIVHELVAMLEFWQRRIKRNPLDLKPANILVRPGRGAGEFVIADFGGVDRLTDSRRFTSAMMVTVAYMAPEQLAGNNHPAGPWWGLGNVLYELFVGRPRFVGADGERADDRELELELVMGEEVDLAAVRDPRQLLLLQGLFTKDPEDRWTASQVRSWLAGGSPEVIRRRPQGQTRAHRPVTFLGSPFTDPVRLTETLLKNSGSAARWLSTGGAERLRDWLRDEVGDTVFDLHYLSDVARARRSRREFVAGVAVLALGAAFAPSAVPHYRDRAIDATGLERIVTEWDGATLIDELVRGGVPAVVARYDCFHPECAGEHCSRLLALAGLPEVLAEVDRLARTVGGGRHRGGGLSPEEWEEAYRQAVRLSIRPEERRRLLGRLSPLPAALHRLPLSDRVSELAAVVAATVVDGVLAVDAGARTALRAAARRPPPDTAAPTARDVVRRRWATLRRRAVAADPAQPHGRAALVAAQALRRRAQGRPERPESAQGVLRARRRAYRRMRARRFLRGARLVTRRLLRGVLLVSLITTVLFLGLRALPPAHGWWSLTGFLTLWAFFGALLTVGRRGTAGRPGQHPQPPSPSGHTCRQAFTLGMLDAVLPPFARSAPEPRAPRDRGSTPPSWDRALCHVLETQDRVLTELGGPQRPQHDPDPESGPDRNQP